MPPRNKRPLPVAGTGGQFGPLRCTGPSRVNTTREDAIPSIIWLWGRADWPSMRHVLEETNWGDILVGDAEAQARALATKLLAL